MPLATALAGPGECDSADGAGGVEAHLVSCVGAGGVEAHRVLLALMGVFNFRADGRADSGLLCRSSHGESGVFFRDAGGYCNTSEAPILLKSGLQRSSFFAEAGRLRRESRRLLSAESVIGRWRAFVAGECRRPLSAEFDPRLRVDIPSSSCLIFLHGSGLCWLVLCCAGSLFCVSSVSRARSCFLVCSFPCFSRVRSCLFCSFSAF